MNKLFGTDGVRGEAGIYPLDEPTIFSIGRSIAVRERERIGRAARIVTGRDTRESGTWIEQAFHGGAMSVGAECESAGVITTPGVAYVTSAFEFDLGAVISASHNPFYDNGIKVFLPSGRKIDEELESAVERDLASAETRGQDGQMIETNVSAEAEMRSAYLEHLVAAGTDNRLDGRRLVIDCANGAASNLVPLLFRRLGADVITINDRPTGRNINENCGSLHLEGLQTAVKTARADFGVAFDGDADRALFVDENGEIVDGDGTLWIMAKSFQDNGTLKSGKVIATVMSNIGLEIALRSRDIEMVRTAVGDKYVLEELLRSNSEIGGEQSGHIIFPKDSLVGDGMRTAIRVLGAVAETGGKFSSAVDGFRRYPQILINVKVANKKPFAEIDAVQELSNEIERQLDGNGRLLLRYSGTENLARVMIEGKDQAEIEGLGNKLAQAVKAALG